MKSFSYTIKDELGIHARPAGMLVKEATQCACSVTLVKGKKSADAKRIFSVMGLGVKCGDTLQIEIDGADEDAIATKLEAFFAENL